MSTLELDVPTVHCTACKLNIEERLEELGCPRAQGYYFARPEPPDALDRLIGGAPLPAPRQPS